MPLSATLLGLLTACTHTDTRPREAGVPITGGNLALACSHEWRLADWTVEADVPGLVAQSEITFRCHRDGRAAGNASINRYTTRFELQGGGALSWRDPGLAVTMMSGPPGLMRQERRFLDAIPRTTRMSVAAGQLILADASTETRLVFDPVTAIEADALIGVWIRPIRNAPADRQGVEGLRFLPEGIAHLIGIYSMNGLTWALDGDRLTISTNTERYPEPQPLTYRITKLDAASLVFAGKGYLPGSYSRVPEAPAEPLPASRAAAIRANLDAYEKVAGRLTMGDAAARFDAYYRDATLRYIDERIDQGDYGATRNEYFLDADGLFHYRSQSELAAQSPGRAGEPEQRLLILAFDRTGAVTRALKVVDGQTVEPFDYELAGPRNRLPLLLEQLRRRQE